MDNVLKTYTVGAIVGLIGGALIVGLPLSWKVDDQHKQLVKLERLQLPPPAPSRNDLRACPDSRATRST